MGNNGKLFSLLRQLAYPADAVVKVFANSSCTEDKSAMIVPHDAHLPADVHFGQSASSTRSGQAHDARIPAGSRTLPRIRFNVPASIHSATHPPIIANTKDICKFGLENNIFCITGNIAGLLPATNTTIIIRFI